MTSYLFYLALAHFSQKVLAGRANKDEWRFGQRDIKTGQKCPVAPPQRHVQLSITDGSGGNERLQQEPFMFFYNAVFIQQTRGGAEHLMLS